MEVFDSLPKRKVLRVSNGQGTCTLHNAFGSISSGGVVLCWSSNIRANK